MNPEREILNLWLNKNGFFTINSIPLENNKIIDILAIKVKEGEFEKVIQIETACSISTLDNIPIKVYSDKFYDKNVMKRVHETIKEHLGVDKDYEKILVIGNTSKIKDFEKLDDVKIVKFEDILLDVFKDLNKQSFRNEMVRTLQLVKFLMLSKSDKMAELFGYSGDNKLLTHQEKEDFLKQLLLQEEIVKILQKKSMETEIATILSGSAFSKPEKLFEAIDTNLMTKRAKKKFEKLIMAKQEQKTKVEKIIEPIKPKEKTLNLFFDN